MKVGILFSYKNILSKINHTLNSIVRQLGNA